MNRALEVIWGLRQHSMRGKKETLKVERAGGLGSQEEKAS